MSSTLVDTNERIARERLPGACSEAVVTTAFPEPIACWRREGHPGEHYDERHQAFWTAWNSTSPKEWRECHPGLRIEGGDFFLGCSRGSGHAGPHWDQSADASWALASMSPARARITSTPPAGAMP